MQKALTLVALLTLTPLHANDTQTFRNYEDTERDSVEELYRLNHTNQTLAFVQAQEKKYTPLNHAKIGMWDVLEKLNGLVDDSDPDLDLPQMVHALQTAESIRADGHPDWLILTGLIHDCGKMLFFFGEPQWAIVGDTFPLGCRFSDKIVYPHLFATNPDMKNPLYQTECGIYERNCGLRNVHMSWGHDEYLYHVVKKYLPEQAAYIIRYHSFYALHQEGEYMHLLDEYDHKMLPWVKLFNQYDLYSKCPVEPDAQDLAPYYQALILQFLPETLAW